MKWIFAALGASALWLAAIALWIGTGPLEDPTDTGDVAIVLGAAVFTDEPSPVFAARIDHAVELYNSGRVKGIIFTGARSKEDILSEAGAARSYAIAAGIPANDISVEERLRTTRQNLIEAQRLMQAGGHRSALIVSDPLHLRRAHLMAGQLGINARTSATRTTRYRTWSTQAPFLAREVYFLHHYWVFGA